MADLAMVFHWAPAAMNEMEIDELARWRAKAVQRLKAMQGESGER